MYQAQNDISSCKPLQQLEACKHNTAMKTTIPLLFHLKNHHIPKIYNIVMVFRELNQYQL
jgi:hypothetical protein